MYDYEVYEADGVSETVITQMYCEFGTMYRRTGMFF